LEVDPVGRLNQTLAQHYEQKLAWYAVDTDTRYDKDLLRIFSNEPTPFASAAGVFVPAPQPRRHPRIRLARFRRLSACARQHDRPADQPGASAEVARAWPRIRAAQIDGAPVEHQGGAPAARLTQAMVRCMSPLRILCLAHPDLIPPDNIAEMSENEAYVWKTEYDVIKTLQGDGHEVRMIGVQTELAPIRDAVEDWKPDIVFNLLEEFHGETRYAQNVVGLLELLRVPYTGCNPRGLMLARGKDLSKKLLKYHRVPVPAFAVFPIGKKVRRPGRLKFPLIVKSLWEDASLGIAQASIVDTDGEAG